MLIKHTLIHFALVLFLPILPRAQDAVKPGTFTVEPPTLQNLGFEWQISGDDNRNATVQTSYRAVGTERWQEALPLLRMGGERIFRKTEFLDYTVPHLFAGSNKRPDGLASASAKVRSSRIRKLRAGSDAGTLSRLARR